MEESKIYIKDYFNACQMDISDLQCDQLMDYFKLLIETNKVMNLTSITEFDEVVKKHFADSAVLIPYFLDQYEKEFKSSSKSKITVCDLGTGAGFPGIPLKIMRPDLDIVLLDSLNKRVKFLNETVEKLLLDTSTIVGVHGRAEDFGRNPEYREKFDLCVSRAVANLATLSEYCMPFVKKGGYFVSYKSLSSSTELEDAKYAIKVLSGKVQNNIEFTLPDTDITRNFIIIEKTGNISKTYPRKSGTPSKEPIHKANK